MKFGIIPLAKAEGAILAHSLFGITGKIAKGTNLTAVEIAELAKAGFDEITVAQLEPGDLQEDTAALALARALVPNEEAQGVRISGAGAGRVNLYAQGKGIARLDSQALNAVNSVDPMITIATVPDFHRVDANSMLATIKIISYGVPEIALQHASTNARAAIRVQPPAYASATLIETTVTPDVPSDKGRRAMAARLDRMGLGLSERVIVPHQQAALSNAIEQAPGEVLLILTGSATSDPADVAPEALRSAGGSVTRFGMPVDPGNLLFLGELQGKPVIGLPGCARSPALNGADWVLERVLCGVPITGADIAAMGVGGLLKEIPTRPMPRRPADRSND